MWGRGRKTSVEAVTVDNEGLVELSRRCSRAGGVLEGRRGQGDGVWGEEVWVLVEGGGADRG